MTEARTELREIEQLRKRYAALKQERGTWDAHYKDLSTFILPRNGRFLVEDRNKGMKRHNSIYDNTGTRASNALAAGMMSGYTSPARPWFKLSLRDKELAQYHPVRLWLHENTERMLAMFARTNLYRALGHIYTELGVFGTGACLVLPDFDMVQWYYPLTVGEYAFTTDHKGNVNTLYRECQRTVQQLVSEFGLESCSRSVQEKAKLGKWDDWHTVIHAIEPRGVREADDPTDRNMPFRSCWFETAADSDRCLRDSGFKRFRALVPRWDVQGADIYGSSPGMGVLGDIRQLQHQQLRKGQAIDYQVNPPLQAPTGIKGMEINRLPGGVTYVDQIGPQNAIRPAYEVNLNLRDMAQDMAEVRDRIRKGFFEDLFLMLANDTSRQMTATEVAERKEEKLLMLGPVLQRLDSELLGPSIDMAFEDMLAAGLLTPPPEELQEQDLVVEYTSMLAQAQKAIGVNAIDRFLGTIGNLASVKPEVLDRIDADTVVDVYSDRLGMDPRVLVAKETADALRGQRQKAAQAQATMAAVQQGAVAARDMAAAGAQPNALQSAIDQFSGYR